MSKTKRSLLITIIALFVILATSVASLLAWLTDSAEETLKGETSDLDLTCLVWFEVDGVEGYSEAGGDVLASEYYIGNSQEEESLKVIEISAGDENAINYVGNLRISLNVDTNAKYYLRARFINEWYQKKITKATNKETFTALNLEGARLMPYNLSSNWHYDINSGYTYFKNLVDENTSTIDIINETTISNYTNRETVTQEYKYFIYLNFEIEYVQANRMYAIWQIDDIMDMIGDNNE